MSKVEYTKIPDTEKVISVTPDAPPPMYEHSELVHTERAFDSPAQSYCLLSTFSFLCCFSPAGLLGMYYGHRTNSANNAGDYAAAHKYSRYAKKAMRWSVAIGIFFTVLALFGHIAFFGAAMHSAKHSFKHGYRAGMPQGEELGRSLAVQMVKDNGNQVGLPAVLPTLPGNVFDVNDPFYRLGSVEAMAEYLGEHFGYTDGFRVGFCKTEGVKCSEQESHTLRWYKHHHGCHGKKHGGHREHKHHEHEGHHEHKSHHEHKEHKDRHEQIAEHIKEVEHNLGVEAQEAAESVEAQAHAMHVQEVIAGLHK